MSNKTCYICNAEGLKWVKSEGKWKLAYHDGTIHVCRDRTEVPNSYQESVVKGNWRFTMNVTPDSKFIEVEYKGRRAGRVIFVTDAFEWIFFEEMATITPEMKDSLDRLVQHLNAKEFDYASNP